MAVFCGRNLRIYEADNEGNILAVTGGMHQMYQGSPQKNITLMQIATCVWLN